MKELLKDYYGLNIEYSKEYRDGLIFFVNGDYYYLCKCYLDEESVNKSYELYLLLKDKNIVLHDFIFNNDKRILTNGYVLLKLNNLISNIDLYDIKKTNIVLDFDIRDDFYSLWTNKIDYYEKQLYVVSSNPFISYSFDYFVGVSEILLDFYKNNKGYDTNYIVHREFYSLNSIDYYNPLNIVIGDRLKDYSAFIRLTNDWDLLYDLLSNIGYEEKVSLFVRLAFPYKYFYYISKLIEDDLYREELVSIVDEITRYEVYLSRLEDVMGIRLFYWIKKDN